MIAVIIMMIALSSRGGVMTDAKVMKRAAELGMIMPEDTQTGTEQLSETETEEPTQQIKPVISTKDTQKADQKETQKEGTNKADTKTDDTQQKDSQAGTKPPVSNSEQKSQNDKNDSDTQKNDNKNSEADKSDEESDEMVEFTIKRGEYCRKIAENLYKMGLVDDAEEFRKYMQDNDYDNTIMVGTFHLKQGMTYQEIAKVLTSKPQ